MPFGLVIFGLRNSGSQSQRASKRNGGFHRLSGKTPQFDFELGVVHLASALAPTIQRNSESAGYRAVQLAVPKSGKIGFTQLHGTS
jgi:hypothetical protein